MRKKSDISIKNRKAGFEYYLVERFVAGMVLTGTEIKSIRSGKANLTDAYCTLRDGNMYVINLHIAEYDFGNIYNHDPRRDRLLLLTKKEIKKLDNKVKEKGFTIIPTVLFINERGLAKIEIALAKGKHSYDKRDSIKQKDLKRDMDRRDDF